MADKVIGIYKITSPTNKVYIGQSKNIEDRFRRYKKKYCKTQIGLYNSFNKHGVDNHTFEVIELCSIDLLNIRERFWQDYYDVLKKGLNCVLQDTSEKRRVQSKESIEKMKKSLTGFKHSKETRIKMSESRKGRKHTLESRIKISESRKGIIFSDEHKKNLSIAIKGKTPFGSTKLILNLETGIYYYGTKEAVSTTNINPKTFRAWMSGQNPNKSNFKYV